MNLVPQVAYNNQTQKTMKEEDFVNRILELCETNSVHEVSREHIGKEHVACMLEFLSEEDDILLSKLFKVADSNKAVIYFSADKAEYICSSFYSMCRKARILICRIIGSQGREIEFNHDGIIVSPHRNRLNCAKEQKMLQAS